MAAFKLCVGAIYLADKVFKPKEEKRIYFTVVLMPKS